MMQSYLSVLRKTKANYVIFAGLAVSMTVSFFIGQPIDAMDKSFELYCSSFSVNIATFVYAPVFAVFFALNQQAIFKNSNLIFRLIKISHLIYARWLVLLVDSMLFSVILNTFFFLALILSGVTISGTFLTAVFLQGILQVCGFFLMGSILNFVNAALGRMHYAFAVFILLLLLEYIGFQRAIQVSIMTTPTFIMAGWVLSGHDIQVIFSGLAGMLLRITLLNAMFVFLLKRSDWYGSREERQI